MNGMKTSLHRSMIASLRTFQIFAQSGSVSQAADALNVTPGAVSQQLKQLESQLNVSLVEREGNRLALTRTGRSLAFQLKSAFDQIELAVEDAQQSRGNDSLRLKLMPSLAICWLMPNLASFYEQHPDIALDIATVPHRDDTTLDQADLAIRLGKGDWNDVEADLLFADAFLPVCSPELASTLKTPRDLLSAPLLHSAMRPEGWDIWFAAQGLSTPRKAKSTRFSNAALAYRAASAGIGIAMAQLPYVQRDLAAGTLVAPFPEPVCTDMGYYLVCARQRAAQPNVRKFREWLKSLRAA